LDELKKAVRMIPGGFFIGKRSLEHFYFN